MKPNARRFCNGPGSDDWQPRHYGDATAGAIDVAVRRLIDDAFARAQSILGREQSVAAGIGRRIAGEGNAVRGRVASVRGTAGETERRRGRRGRCSRPGTRGTSRHRPRPGMRPRRGDGPLSSSADPEKRRYDLRQPITFGPRRPDAPRQIPAAKLPAAKLPRRQITAPPNSPAGGSRPASAPPSHHVVRP